jgi:hypothetical protein
MAEKPAAIFKLPGGSGGTGANLTRATIIVAGVASLVATLVSIVYVLSGKTQLTIQIDMAPGKELSETASAEIRGSYLGDGADLRHRLVVQPDFSEGCLLGGSDT